MHGFQGKYWSIQRINIVLLSYLFGYFVNRTFYELFEKFGSTI